MGILIKKDSNNAEINGHSFLGLTCTLKLSCSLGINPGDFLFSVLRKLWVCYFILDLQLFCLIYP